MNEDTKRATDHSTEEWVQAIAKQEVSKALELVADEIDRFRTFPTRDLTPEEMRTAILNALSVYRRT